MPVHMVRMALFVKFGLKLMMKKRAWDKASQARSRHLYIAETFAKRQLAPLKPDNPTI